MTKKAKQRLTILADFLATKVKPKWFNLSVWGDAGFPEKECGTTACAGGWATVAFPGKGLTLVKNGPSRHGYDLEIRYRDLDAYEAVGAFFDIDEASAEYLFAPHMYGKEDKKYVVARIRQAVKTGTYDNDGETEPILAWSFEP